MNGVGAIVVTFHPDDSVWENLRALRRQVAVLVVVDNASDPQTRGRLWAFAAEERIEIIENETNLGIAAALNQGAARAIERGVEWFATFDQDSRVSGDFLAALIAAVAQAPDPDRVALVAPLYRDRYLGTVWSASGPIRPTDDTVVPVSVAATSGNLVNARAFVDVGGFREDFFIDLVDFEFCLRLRRCGWSVIETRAVQLEHAQGRAHRRSWLWRHAVINDYSAQRRYYQARNRLVLYSRYALFDVRWTLRDAVGYASDLTKLLLFCTDRRAKARAILTGYWHALTGRRGRWTVAR